MSLDDIEPDKSFGQVAYEAFCKKAKELGATWLISRHWDELPREKKLAWAEAAEAVMFAPASCVSATYMEASSLPTDPPPIVA